jgi:hypothetical protein
MYYFKFLRKFRTFTPSLKNDIIRFGFNSFLFGFILETIFLFTNKYKNFYKTAFLKELERVKQLDEKIEETMKINKLKQEKIAELKELEKKLQNKK